MIHRLSLVYVLTQSDLTILSWWGLGRPERLELADLESAVVLRGMALGLAGCGHVHLRSNRAESGGLTILAQPRAEALAGELETLARAARAKERDGEEDPFPGDD
jgi:hypothetical protein